MSRSSDDDDSVGYRKPPKHTRFQPGRSGNPKGRPKGSKNLKTDLLEELRERILVREGGKTRFISKQRAMLKALTTKAMKGDVRATSQVDAMIRRLIDTGEPSPEAAPTTFADWMRLASKSRAREEDGEP